jgi:hypothetical protein
MEALKKNLRTLISIILAPKLKATTCGKLNGYLVMHHEDVWGSGGADPCTLELCII